MALRPILTWPDPLLSRPCAPVTKVTDEVRALAEDLLETMYAAPGRGLAAPQVGVLQRIFVMDASWKEGAPRPEVVIDPVLDWASDELVAMEEGCLSLPGIAADVIRPEAIRLCWTDPDGAPRAEAMDGVVARIALHELDHLDGRVTLDRVSAVDRARLETVYRP